MIDAIIYFLKMLKSIFYDSLYPILLAVLISLISYVSIDILHLKSLNTTQSNIHAE